MAGTRGKTGRMVKRNEKSSDYVERSVPIEKLYLDLKNPRIEDPSEELIKSVKKDGVKEPLITWQKNENKILICDGWERYQAGIMANLTEFTCHVYTDHLKALKRAKLVSIVKPWTKYQKYKFCKIFYDTCIEEGMTEEKALQRTINDLPYNEQTIYRYLRVMTDLPSTAQSLLKKPKNRTREEWNKLEHYNISFKKKILSISVTDAIVQNLKNFSEEKICQIAVDLLGLNATNAKKAIYRVSQNPDIDPFKIITKIVEGYNPETILHVGKFIVEPELKKAIGKYVSTRLITPKGLIKELLEDWFITSGNYSVLINVPEEGEKKEIKSISFKRKKYIIKIFQISGYPVVKIEGKPSIFFAYEEVKKRAWNQYVGIPQYLKNFLNSLRIEFEEK